MLITIKRLLPSQNKSAWSHWRVYAKERDVWYAMIRAKLTPRKPPEHKVLVAIVSYRNREIDYGNLVGGAKPIPDALVKLGYLKDDKPKWMECSYKQVMVKKAEERTTIEITPTPPNPETQT